MFFQSDYNDLMPPEPETGKAAPEKTGLARFLEIVSSRCGSLLKVNLLFLLGCIPIVTLPLSLYAMNCVVLQMAQDRPVKCLRDYWEAFRREWKRGYLAFLLTAPPLGLAGCGAWFYLDHAASNLLFLLPFLVCSTIFLITLLSSGYLYGLLGRGKTVRQAVRQTGGTSGSAAGRRKTAAVCTGGAVFLWLAAVGCAVFPAERIVSALDWVFFPLSAGAFLPADRDEA